MPRGLHKFSYLTRDQTRAPAGEAQSLNNWTAREVCPFYCTEYWFSKKKRKQGRETGKQGKETEKKEDRRHETGEGNVSLLWFYCEQEPPGLGFFLIQKNSFHPLTF